MALEMEPSWKKSAEYYCLESNTSHTVYNLIITEEDKEIRLGKENIRQEKFEENHHIGTILLPEPVYVIKVNDVEEIRYSSAFMKLNKIYEIKWNQKQYGIRKTDKEVEILRFYPDEK